MIELSNLCFPEATVPVPREAGKSTPRRCWFDIITIPAGDKHPTIPQQGCRRKISAAHFRPGHRNKMHGLRIKDLGLPCAFGHQYSSVRHTYDRVCELETRGMHSPGVGKSPCNRVIDFRRVEFSASVAPIRSSYDQDSSVREQGSCMFVSRNHHAPRGREFAFIRVPRVSFAMCTLRDGRVLVAGGNVAGRYPNAEVVATAEIYDPPHAPCRVEFS